MEGVCIQLDERSHAVASGSLAGARPQWKACASSWTEWDLFYRASNAVLQGENSTETCDCFRKRCCGSAVENRVYVNARRNLSLAFFQWQGSESKPRGASDVWALARSFREARPVAGEGPRCPVGMRHFPPDGIDPSHEKAKGELEWEAEPAVLLRLLGETLRPTHLVVNSGWWKASEDAGFWRNVAAAGAGAAHHAIWRTTPRPFPSISIAERARLAAVKMGGVRLDLDGDVSFAPFRRHGWRLWNAKHVVRSYQQSTGRSASETFVDSVHLWPHANVHVIKAFVSEVLSDSRVVHGAAPLTERSCGRDISRDPPEGGWAASLHPAQSPNASVEVARARPPPRRHGRFSGVDCVARLQKQLSNAPCADGAVPRYGCDAGELWVVRGCRGLFHCHGVGPRGDRFDASLKPVVCGQGQRFRQPASPSERTWCSCGAPWEGRA